MTRATRTSYFIIALTAFLLTGLLPASAQNLIYNGDISLTSTGWTTSCVTVECYGFETSYGGPSATNHVAEIDDEACMHQDVCVLPGYSFIFSMDASCRTAGGPNPCISHIKITGLDVGGVAVATYVDMDYTRTNTTFALTPVTGIPAFTVAPGSGVIKVRVELTDNTPGYLTLGMIVDNISLTYLAGPTAGAPVTTCQGVPAAFSVPGAPAGLTYSWMFGPGATPATSGSDHPSAAWSSAGSYTVKVALGNGTCADTLTYPVTVTPSVTSTVTATTCAQPYSFGGHTYTTSGTYTDTQTAAGGCDSITTLLLTVNPLPAAPVITPAFFCQYDVASPLTAAGSALTWYGPGITAGYTTPPVAVTTAVGTQTYYVTQSLLGCTSDSAVVTVTVRPHPLPPTVKDTAYCRFQLAAPLEATGSNVQWYTTPTGGAPIPVPPVPSTLAAGMQYWYVVQAVNGCVSSRTPQAVKVSAPPVFHITSDKNIICINDTASLVYTGDASVMSYAWILPGIFNVTAGTTYTAGLTIVPIMTGLQDVYLRAADSTGRCTAIDTLRLNVVPVPGAAINTPGGVCLGDAAELSLDYRSDNADSFVWYIDNTPLRQSPYVNLSSRSSNSGGPFILNWNTTGQHIVSMYTVSRLGGCRSEVFFDSVNVSTAPSAAFTVQAGSKLCLQDSVAFQAQETAYAYHYQWSPDQYFESMNQPFTWGRMNDEKSVVTLTVTDANGCKSTSSQELDPAYCCRVDIPNAFTPNGDLRNDVFRPVAAGFHRFHRLTIANRWGQVVFSSSNNMMEWDGTMNGVPQDMGVYYYVLTYDCGGNAMTQKGDVTLVR